VSLVPDETVETLVRHFADHLHSWGGAPLMSVFDRPKTVALKWQRDGVVTEWNPTFAYAALEIGVGVDVCWPYRPQETFRQSARRQPSRQGQILGSISIRERPPEVDDRAVPGHWEGDLLVGGHNTQIATLVERTSRYAVLVKVPRKDAVTVRKAMQTWTSTLAIRRVPGSVEPTRTPIDCYDSTFRRVSVSTAGLRRT
jgi:hypothetical protein